MTSVQRLFSGDDGHGGAFGAIDKLITDYTKSGGLVASRQEYEYPIPVDEAGELLALADGPLIDKTRHLVEHGRKTWEVDEFHGANTGLVVAEIELTREDEQFASPPWLGAEVTLLERYYNVCLVSHPYCAWTEAERAP